MTLLNLLYQYWSSSILSYTLFFFKCVCLFVLGSQSMCSEITPGSALGISPGWLCGPQVMLGTELGQLQIKLPSLFIIYLAPNLYSFDFTFLL